ncbi:MAG TPA: CBS domain-containing protein [Baekduia sp.]|nr:CBS domain-containing protein [Baekduia sp.]
MTPQTISDLALHEPQPIHVDDTVAEAVRQLADSGLPAIPVVDGHQKYKGIFGEREFMEALFPGYLGQLHGAAFISRSLDDALEKRDSCRNEPVARYMNTEHIDVGPDFADTQIAEIFMHHRVLIIPVVAVGRVQGVITRMDFFRAMTERFLAGGSA